ncbi:GNAT family N-acetyltransferase [Sporosarcina sp. FSL K6-1522]|uniref:GNAT family N-acetyltransferase n=1 Tax=Sporosarcina sp. FSL K6-1522 TaxID=2921554 RepID=UPI003159BDFD
MIRLMTATDIVHVQHIIRHSWGATYEGLIPENTQMDFIDRSYSDAMMRMRMKRTIVLIAECEGVPIGFANFTKTDEDGDTEMTAMYILPTHQHAGYGTKLFQHALSMLEDAKHLFIYVDSLNTTGRAFYEKQGFELVDVFPEYFEGHPVVTAQYVYCIQNPALVVH